MPFRTTRPRIGSRTAILAALAAILLAVVLVPCAARAAGQHLRERLDPSFGRAGLVKTVPLTAGEGSSVELAIAPDGGLVVANLGEGRMIRLAPDGRPERRFGNHGFLSLSASAFGGGRRGRAFFASSIAVDQMGRLVVFGKQSAPGRFLAVPGSIPEDIPSSFAIVARFENHGRPDPAFGNGKGYVREDFGLISPLSSEIPLVGAMGGVVDSRNRPVVLAGVTSTPSRCALGRTGPTEEVPRALVRLTSSGAQDLTFGMGGVSPIDGTTNFPQLQIAGQDQLAVGAGPVGTTRTDCRNGDVIYRLGPDGERSDKFGAEGTIALSGMRFAALESSGAVVVGRRRSRTLLLERFSPTGRREESFGRAGIARLPLPPDPGVEVSSVLVEKGGGILVVGFSGGDPSEKRADSFMIARLSSRGKVVTDSGHRAWGRTPLTRPLELTSIQGALDPRGRLIVAGTTATPGSREGGFLVARYLRPSA